MNKETGLQMDKHVNPVRNIERPVQKYRLTVQIAFALLCVWIGVQFHYFVGFLDSGGTTTFVSRPPGVEGFLPISSLMSLYYFFQTGEIHAAHPAGLIILAAILIMSLAFGKVFCSWLCPIGFVSEVLGDLGDKIFKRRLRLPKALDWPLRFVKYLLLGFFIYIIFFVMTELALQTFLDSPYNLTADIKMYYFFAEITPFALTVIVGLILLSIPIRGFWCRYLCPYGALLGILSLLSPQKIKRNPATCIDCGKCAKVCPSFIKVDKINTVWSDECTSCMACVDACPVANTLEVKSLVARRRVPKRLAAVVTVGIFVAITGAAMLTGHWQNSITTQQYIEQQPYVRGYGHPISGSEMDKLGRPQIDDQKQQ
ncbi:MAG: 4Fe-4S binding protein [candidate division Zixibacteria bacterium]|nr:4Fe-4S binding protein [candidate division Zixibacteria bacterium]